MREEMHGQGNVDALRRYQRPGEERSGMAGFAMPS